MVTLTLRRFDDDLVKNSAVLIETLVKVGDSLGHSVVPAGGFDTAGLRQ